MTSVAFLSLCLVVLLAHLNQVKSDDDISLTEDAVERMKRDAVIELYHRMKRQGGVDFQVGKDGNDPWARLKVDREFGRNGRHRVGGNVDWSRGSGFSGGLGADFNWNKGRTRFTPEVNFGRGGVTGAGFRFTHRFGRKR